MKLSVYLPSIRTHLLGEFYRSLELSCSRHSFEVVIGSPFDLPEELKEKTNVKLVKTYASPTIAAKLAALSCSGDVLLHCTDDVLFYPNEVSNELDSYHPDMVTGLRYNEGKNFSGKELPPHYWIFGGSYNYKYLGPNGINAVHNLMSRDWFLEYGGFDCAYQYLTHAMADLLARMYRQGVIWGKLSVNQVSSADWEEGISGSHLPINNAQLYEDAPRFYRKWHLGEGLWDEISLEDYKEYPEIWSPRFKGELPSSYEDLGYV
ncbi:MAG: hypothetical protein ACHQ1D_01415 [Nitrososphaerales archaeon]